MFRWCRCCLSVCLSCSLFLAIGRCGIASMLCFSWYVELKFLPQHEMQYSLIVTTGRWFWSFSNIAYHSPIEIDCLPPPPALYPPPSDYPIRFSRLLVAPSTARRHVRHLGYFRQQPTCSSITHSAWRSIAVCIELALTESYGRHSQLGQFI